MRGDPPRHIRDIAHLYLSRMRRPGGGGVRLVMAGMSADLIPAFHVANLALAAAARGITTRIEDRSGLPVNAGCFLGLDPSCWVATEDARAVPVSAFARVTFTLNPERESPVELADGVEIMHVPPFDAGSEHERTVCLTTSQAIPTVVLYLAERDAEPRPWREADERDYVDRRVAYVTRARRAGAEDDCAGSFTRWRRALTDPLPVVVRDPDSRLARQYLEALSKLLTSAPMAHFGARDLVDPTHAVSTLEPR